MKMLELPAPVNDTAIRQPRQGCYITMPIRISQPTGEKQSTKEKNGLITTADDYHSRRHEYFSTQEKGGFILPCYEKNSISCTSCCISSKVPNSRTKLWLSTD